MPLSSTFTHLLADGSYLARNSRLEIAFRSPLLTYPTLSSNSHRPCSAGRLGSTLPLVVSVRILNVKFLEWLLSYALLKHCLISPHGIRVPQWRHPWLPWKLRTSISASVLSHSVSPLLISQSTLDLMQPPPATFGQLCPASITKVRTSSMLVASLTFSMSVYVSFLYLILKGSLNSKAP